MASVESPRYDAEVADDEAIFVITRTNKKELLDTNKIVKRLQTLINRPPRIAHVNPYELMLKVTSGLKSLITTSQIDEYAADAAASLSLSNPYYMRLASRIVVDNHQKNTDRSFTDKMRKAYLCTDQHGNITSIVSEEFYKYVEEHQDFIERTIDYSRDFLVDYFGFRTFERMYGNKVQGKIIERPQDLYMRAAIALHMNTIRKSDHVSCDVVNCTCAEELDRIKETYDLLSTKSFTCASPTYFNAGTSHPQYASCFLLGTEDSLDGIKKTDWDMAKISKWAGGIGVHVNCWRGTGAWIRGTNGPSSGIVPFLKGYNENMVAFNQGGKRPGSAAIYLMPHHPDIVKFLELRLKTGEDRKRARDLFYALWIPDIFMQRVKQNAMWSLFDPDAVGDLSNLFDTKEVKLQNAQLTIEENLAYTKRYLELEEKKLYASQIPARELWKYIYNSNKDNGMPYLLFSDTANRCSMMKNTGVLKSSNLCSEIMINSSSTEYGTCVLCSISLSSCVVDNYTAEELKLPEKERRVLDHEFPLNPSFDYEKLIKLTEISVVNLNNIIDKNYYPVKETKRSSLRHRPIGIGVQGLADAYIKMRFPFDSMEAADLNKRIFETLYYAAVSKSTKMCRKEYQELVKRCKTQEVFYSTYVESDYKQRVVRYTDHKSIPTTIAAYPSMLWNGGSPISKGIFHWELAGKKSEDLSQMYDWESLRDHVKTYGVKNCLLIALMPTASTSQFLGNNECIEPYTSNIYKRKTSAGEFIVINKYLIHDMFRLGIWNLQMKEYLLVLEGSIQSIEGIPDDLKQLYKTAYEINPSVLIDQACDRQPFVDQAQSLNWYLSDLNEAIFAELSFRAWRGGLKTGKYYLHSQPAVSAQKFTVDPAKQKEMMEKLEAEKHLRSLEFLEPKKIDCLVCSA